MQSPSISVIVPVYNVQAWLPACVESLLCQTFTDFELILVDDGSPDACPALCDEYAKRDSRVRVIHQQNGGLSAARNAGLQIAQGETIAFVDSDDTVAPTYLDQLFSALCDSNADLAICAVEDVSEDGSSLAPAQITLPTQVGIFSGKELLKEFFGNNSTYYTVAWNKLYRRSLWQTLRYPNGMIHEDDAVAHQLFWASSTVVCVDAPLYHYRLRSGSICRTAIGAGSFDGVTAHADWCRFFHTHNLGSSLLGAALTGCFRRYLSLCAQAQGNITWELFARWHNVQLELRALLPLLLRYSSLNPLEKLSCLRWCYQPLPQPPKGDKPRVALLVPPDLPIPAVHGGAVEGLVTHLVRQNQIEKKLELLVVSPFDAQALQAAHPYSQTLFCYVPKANTLQTLWHRVCYKISCITGGSRYWNIYNHQATKRLKKYFFDFAICEGGCLDSWSETAAFVGANRMIAHMHGMTTSNPLVDSLYHAGISISNYALQEWQATSTLPGNANYILPNCVDLSLFNTLPNPAAAQRKASLGFSSQDFVVFFCGRVCDGKGIHKLVQAMLQISDPHVKLLVAGSPFFAAQADSPFFEELRLQAQALGDRIQFLGFVPNEELPLYYQIADVACFPALWDEPAGITAIEAMACGCPVIASNSGGMPEYLSGSGAILVERDETIDSPVVPDPTTPPLPQQLAQAICTLKDNPAQREAMAKAGAQCALSFSVQEYYKRFVSIIQSEQQNSTL